jgi:hypothetical protein
MREIVLDLDSPEGYNGLGDVISLAWLAETAKQCNTSFVFFSKDPNKIKLFSIFQQKHVNCNKDAIPTASIYKAELECACNKPKLDLLKEAFGLHGCGEDIRPKHRISEVSILWAENTYTHVINDKSKFVMLFPGASFNSRQYPPNYWCDIAWKLHGNGISCAVFDHSYSDTFEKFPLWFYGLNLEDLAALVKRADLVVGNDSFPANLSGTLATPTLALMGPTSPNLYKHMPNVKTLMSSQMHCTGCHFGKPFRSCCDLGCMSLFRLLPDEVLENIYSIFNHEQHIF